MKNEISQNSSLFYLFIFFILASNNFEFSISNSIRALLSFTPSSSKWIQIGFYFIRDYFQSTDLNLSKEENFWILMRSLVLLFSLSIIWNFFSWILFFLLSNIFFFQKFEKIKTLQAFENWISIIESESFLHSRLLKSNTFI